MNASRDRLIRTALLIVAVFLLGAHGVRAQTASQLYAQGVQAYEQGDVAQAKAKLQLTLEVDKNFRPATALLGRIALEQKATAGANPAATVPVKSLARLIVPVEFKDTTLQTALEYLRQHVDAASGGKTQVNFVLNLPPELANKKISLQLDHVPVTEVLRYIGDLAGVSFQVQPYAILVTPAASAPAAAATSSVTP